MLPTFHKRMPSTELCVCVCLFVCAHVCMWCCVRVMCVWAHAPQRAFSDVSCQQPTHLISERRRQQGGEGRDSEFCRGGGEGEVANLSGGHAPRETSAVSASERARAGASLSPTLLLAALFSGTQHLACPHQLALPDRTPTTPQPMLYTLYGLAGAVRGRVRVEWWGRRAASPRRKFTQKKQIPSSSSFFHQVVGATEGLVRALPRAVSVPAPVPVAPPVSNRADMVRAAGRGERERKRTPFICAPALPTPCSRSLPVPPISPSTPPATRPAWWRSSSWATAGMRRGDGDGE